MPGGLIHISSYGSGDLYLTGVPQITFFKNVYRRHTNFSIESIRIGFDNNVGFGKESTVVIKPIGNLIHKMYLEIILPEINIKRNLNDQQTNIENARDLFIQTRNDYRTLSRFFEINRLAYTVSNDIFEATNSDGNTLVSDISQIFSSPVNSPYVDNAKTIFNNQNYTFPYRFEEVSLESIVTSIPSNSDKEDYQTQILNGLNKNKAVQNYLYNTMNSYYNIYKDSINDNLLFAWTDKIGHSIIDYIEVKIGNEVIDRHYGDWINIWHELTKNNSKEKTYLKMIGDVDELKNFDREIKPKYVLQVPLQFWFCRHSSLALPLVAIQHLDVRVNVKFRNINDVAYMENNELIFISNTDRELYLNELPTEVGIDIDANLLVDYVYLDQRELKRFATSSHEYLIETTQRIEVLEIESKDISINLDNFINPTKEFIWFSRNISYIQNNTGYEKTSWCNYSTSLENKNNPFETCQLFISNENITPNLQGNYFNYLQPWKYHSSTPADGINVYSFSLSPEDTQPTGSVNMSNFRGNYINATISDDLQNLYDFYIYSLSHNIIRIISGRAMLGWK